MLNFQLRQENRVDKGREGSHELIKNNFQGEKSQ